jgi:thiosulfate/3-mercaptopyruvate sulfurtransferase
MTVSKANSRNSSLLVEPSFLAQHRTDPMILIVDCSKSDAYERAHIPEAIHIMNDYWLKDPENETNPRGIHLMSPQSLVSVMSEIGIADDRLVVAYDDNSGRASARLWWVLTYLGHPEVSVLNGGWHAWVDERRPVSYTRPQNQSGKYTPHVKSEWLATREDVIEALRDGGTQIVDARSIAEWSGEDSHDNTRAGHIPGAIHLEWNSLMSAGPPWRFRPVPELRLLVREAGVDPEKPMITYCQGGVRASHVAFTLSAMGFKQVKVYDGSMREWANNATLPLAKEED